MSKLSDEKIDDLSREMVKSGKSVNWLCRAIEAAVLEELAKQKPAYTFHLDSTGAAYLRGECVSKEGDPLYAAPVVQEKQEPVAWMHWYKYYDGTDVVKVAIGRATTFNDQSPFRSEPLYAAPVVQQKAEPIRHALENCRLFAARHRKEEWAGHILRFCADSGAIGSTMRESVVQPDMVMVPREPTEAMLDAAMNRYQHVSPEAKARYTQMHRENFRCDYKAMIAAAEWKSNAAVKGGAE